MITWKEYDTKVEQEIASSYVEVNMLRAQLAVLIVKRVVTYQTSVDKIQNILAERYDIKYNPSDIFDELKCMKLEEQESNKYTLEPEDYFEGY